MTESPALAEALPAAPPRRAAGAGGLRWTAWPLRDRFPRLWWAPVVAVAAAAVAGGQTASLVGGLLAGAALWLTLLPVWAPVTYVIGETALEIRCLGLRRRIPWATVRAYRRNRRGATLFVSPVDGRRSPSGVATIRVACDSSGEQAYAQLRRRLASAREVSAA